jgi:site-specific recombinase XerD
MPAAQLKPTSNGCGGFCGFTSCAIHGRWGAEVNAFLTHLAVEGQVSATTQNQDLAARLFLYRVLLEQDLDLEGVVRARQKRRLPVVLSPGEVRAVLERMDGVEALVSEVLYGSGLRALNIDQDETVWLA